MIGHAWPQPFALNRAHDPSGVSGVGVVATGVVWPDGRAAMRWTGATPPTGHDQCVRQLNLFDDVAEIAAVHGHGGHSALDMRDPSLPCADLGMAVFGIVGWYGQRSRVTYWGVRWDSGPAVTWRNDDRRPARIEQWPDGGAHAAFSELADLSADEVRIAWVPHDALTIASVTRGIEGRRWQRRPGPRRGTRVDW